MSDYRLDFLDGKGTVLAHEVFDAADDEAAVEICRVVADACTEQYVGYAVWNLARMVLEVPHLWNVPKAPKLEEISQSRQEGILKVEDCLQRSRWRVRESRRLIERTEALRSILHGGDRAA